MGGGEAFSIFLMKILIKDKYGNQLVETNEGGIGVRNLQGKFITKHETREWIKENKLGNKVRLRTGGELWIHNDLLK